ncbi:hypothetical protein IQ782_29385 [Salipiger pacificus]|uniref:Uncharacterized protein n=1 Tax=Salipiger mangrovisoli TaxID=2865933 RepID=A0ABR9XC28_9RHOB|nr:hypothetical protein [Salipiger mangrovisoli]
MIRAVLPPSSDRDHLAKRADPARLSDRARRDAIFRPEIRCVFEEHWQVCGLRSIVGWRASTSAQTGFVLDALRQGSP